MIVRIDRDRVDGDRRQQRVVGRNAPSRGAAATVGRFPNSAADRRRVSDNGAVRRRRRIDHDVVHPALGQGVIVASGTAGHSQRLRTE